MIVMKTFEEFSDKFFTESIASKELRDSGNLARVSSVAASCAGSRPHAAVRSLSLRLAFQRSA